MTRPTCAFFLSHQYRATDVNLFFYGLFAPLANVHFEVDAGTFATNVTRLERKLRGVDAFVGIYPSILPTDASLADLRRESRYFRLEIDLATRAGKPSLVFYDGRYKQLLLTAPDVDAVKFDTQELVGTKSQPSAPLFTAVIRRFIDRVVAWKVYDTRKVSASISSDVGVLLPSAYPAEAVTRISGLLEERGFNPVVLQANPVLTLDLLRRLHGFDFVVADLGGDAGYAPLIGYVHGQAIPMMRLRFMGDDRGDAVERALCGGVEVGYAKDIIRWTDIDELAEGFQRRLSSLEAPSHGIRSRADAEKYFRGASLRKEAVFVSYSGEDVSLAAPLLAALKRRFETVFDYRDAGVSIPPGSAWLPKIFESLAQSAIGISLVSSSYFTSGNCTHEAEALVARRDNGQLKLFLPIKLRKDEKFDLPPWLQSQQYLRLWEYRDASEVVAAVESAAGKA